MRLTAPSQPGEDPKIFCFDLSEKQIWETTHGPAWTETKNCPGARWDDNLYVDDSKDKVATT